MKSKSLILLAVAAGFGLVAMLGVMQVINGKGGKEPTVRVLTAAVDIPSGMPLSEDNVVFKEMPQSAVPGGAVTKKEEYEGKAIISRAVAGEIIMTAKLGGAEAITASHQIPKGMRVATVSVDATKSHSGLIRPTDRVDVVCTYEMADQVTRQKSTHVKTVLEFIEVFAVDSVRAGREGEVDSVVKNVSLLCTPEQVQLLTAVRDLGKLDLSLRNREDKERTEVAELSDAMFQQKDTSGGSREQPEEKPAPPAETAEGSGLQDFLASAMTAVSSVATVPAAEETPTWTMMICRGDKLEDVEVLDEGALPLSLSAAERQRRRAASRLPAEEREGSGATDPAAGKTAAPSPPAADDEPAPSAQPAPPASAAPAGAVPQASIPAPTTPALLPFTPIGG